jgi:hypothetical protein
MIKVKEMTDDAIINIQVNKTYYLMAKAASFVVLHGMDINTKGEAYFKEISTKKYEELDDQQKTFYTLVLLLSEIESKAKEQKLYTEKEVLEPGDEGFVAPVIPD